MILAFVCVNLTIAIWRYRFWIGEKHECCVCVFFKVTVYGDGTGVPLSLKDWALVDYDYLKTEGENYKTPHCIAETIQPLTQKIKE